MEKIAVLLNPSAGKGKSIKKKEGIEHSLRNAGIPYDMFVSESEGHLRRLAHQAINDYRAVAGVGGDTTFQIIAGEILKNRSRDESWPAPVLGMFGTGSANDIARSLDTGNIETLCTAIRTGTYRDMDVGCVKINGRDEPAWFLGSLSAGLGTTVNRYIEDFCQRHPGLAKSNLTGQALPGLLAVRRSFSRGLVPLEATLETGDISKQITFSLLVIANIPFYANGLCFHPDISPFDGSLDVVIIHTDSFGQTLRFAVRLSRQKHFQEERFEVISSPGFRLTCPRRPAAAADRARHEISEKAQNPGNETKFSLNSSMEIQLDGDIITGVDSMDVSLLPGALKVFTGFPAREQAMRA